MNRLRSFFLHMKVAAVAMMIAGCGGSGSSSNNTPTNPVSVSLSTTPPTSLATSATATLGATVANDNSNAGVRWTVTCGSSACGSFNPTTTASGGSTTFTAPSAVPSGNTVTVTATSVTDGTKTASATITIAAPVQPISVTLAAQPPMSLVAATTTNITANVANDSANAGVKWTVTCGSSGCGSFNPVQTASGGATVYTAPSAVPTGNTVTVTATSVTDTTKSASATITITAAVVPIAVTFAAQPPTSLATNATTNITANVANDSANGGVKWTVTCGTSACGSFNPATTASGAATIFMAPSAIPTGNTVTVTATSVTDTTKSATATITITALSGAPLADGTYVYHLAGQDVNGPCFFVGAFTLANGAITGGRQDFSDSNTSGTDSISTTGSSISYASNGNIQLVVATTDQNVGVNGVTTLRGTKVSATRVLLSGYDDFSTGSGSIDLQTSQAAPSGGYAFLIAGVGFDTNSNAVATALGGVLNISGTTISTSNSVFDVNFGGQNLSVQSFTAGTVSAPDSLGRVTIGLTPASSTGLVGITLTGYIVSPNQIQLVESQDAQGFNLGGMALAQGSNTGTFNAASLAGKTFVFGSSGVDGNGVLDLAGTFAFGSNSTVLGSMAVNDLTAFGTNTITGGSYTVDSTGRVTLIGVALSAIMETLSFQAYLDGNGNAMMMGADGVEVTAGPAYLQTTSSPTVFGTYGLTAMGFLTDKNGSPWSATGPVTINSGNYSGFTDYNNSGTLTAGVSLTGTTATSGTISLTGLNALSFTTGNSFVNYPVDGNRVVSISIDAGLLSLGTLESVKH